MVSIIYIYIYIYMYIYIYIYGLDSYRFSIWIFQVALLIKKLPANAGDVRDVGSIPGSGRCLGRKHANPLQYYCLENPMDKLCWTQLMRLSTHTHTCMVDIFLVF